MKNYNEIPIKLSGFTLENNYMLINNNKNISELILDHYKYELIKNIIIIIGSADILGNPVRTLEYINQGFDEFKHECQIGYL